MRAINRILTISFILLSIFIFTQDIFAYQNEPKGGFRGMAWRADITNFKDLKLDRKDGNFLIYVKENDDLDFEGILAEKIEYEFFNNKFQQVNFYFNLIKADDVRKKLLEKYGNLGSRDNSISNLIQWQGTSTGIDLFIDSSGCKVKFRALNDDSEWFQQVKLDYVLGEETAKKYNNLIDSGSSKENAAKELADWLNKEKLVEAASADKDVLMIKHKSGVTDAIYNHEDGYEGRSDLRQVESIQ
ncbi:MAG: hypothetical protein WC532_01425 [Candidatus Omnitrophota bacterium]